MGFILSLIYIIFFTYSLALIIKEKFERLIPFTFIISGLMLYLSQYIFKTFYIGLIICIIFSLIFPIKLIIKKEKIEDIKNKYFTNGVKAFLILSIIILIIDFNRFYTRWDELSHWGKMVKEMFKLNSFYSVDNSNLLVHKDYPPIMSLIELFYSYISLGFKEVNLIRCMHLFESTIILSCLNFNKENNKELRFKTIISTIIIYFLTFLLDTAIVINSIYIDYILALFTAATLFNIFKMKDYNINEIFLLSLSCIFLLLLKQVCIAFYLMILFLFILIIIVNKFKLNIKKVILSIVLLIIMPILFLLSWNKYIDSLSIKGQFEVSDIKISSLKTIMQEDNYQKETIINFKNALISKSILNSKIKLSYVTLFVIVVIVCLVLLKKQTENVQKKKILLLLITLSIGFVGYILLMLLLYVFSFGPIEGPSLASYDRYMSTYILICLYTLFSIYIYNFDIKIENRKKYMIFIILLMLLIRPSSYLRLRPDLIILDNHVYDEYKNISRFIDDKVSDMDRIMIIDQSEITGAKYYINYFSNKIRTNDKDYIFSDYNEETIKKIRESDYLYTYNINDDFIENYKFLSENRIESKALYKIKKNKNKMQLIKVE